MTLEGFVAARQARWAELEAAVKALGRNRLRGLRGGDIERFAMLYRRTASDLAIAQRDFSDEHVREYLNSLCGRAHILVNRGQPPRLPGALGFFAAGVPRLFRANARYFLVAMGCVGGGAGAGWLAYVFRPDLRGDLVPSSLFDQMARGGTITVPAPLLTAPSLFLHNIEVGLIVFILGVCLGLPSALLLFQNGWILGTLGAAVHAGGYDYAFWSLIAAHGVLELSIIITAGAAGLRLGDALLRPGLRTRAEALTEAGRGVVGLLVGTLVLLVVAGCLEAFISPSDLPRPAKVAIGLGVGAGFYAWLLLGGRDSHGVRPAFLLDAAGGSSPAPHRPRWRGQARSDKL